MLIKSFEPCIRWSIIRKGMALMPYERRVSSDVIIPFLRGNTKGIRKSGYFKGSAELPVRNQEIYI